MDDLGKWLQGRYTKPRPSATPVTALRLVLDGPEWTKLGLEPKYAYGSKSIAVEPIPVGPGAFEGVGVRIDDPVAGAQAKPWRLAFFHPVVSEQARPWRLEFDAPWTYSLDVGEYGGAGGGKCGPAIAARRWMPKGALSRSDHWLDNGPGEFVVREIELKDQMVVRLAIDFITDTTWEAKHKGNKGIPRRIVRGSLRYNSQFEPSVPELDPDAAE
jgi:hypothetical protein